MVCLRRRLTLYSLLNVKSAGRRTGHKDLWLDSCGRFASLLEVILVRVFSVAPCLLVVDTLHDACAQYRPAFIPQPFAPVLPVPSLSRICRLSCCTNFGCLSSQSLYIFARPVFFLSAGVLAWTQAGRGQARREIRWGRAKGSLYGLLLS